ncbi:MAG: hypothetical protein ACYC3I_23495 [Gemmataceae bacterium]
MRKSSRLWWLHGVVLLSAALGCNRNCTTGGSSCGTPATGGVPYTGSPVMSGGATGYSQSSPSGYPGLSGMPSGAGSMSSAGAGYGMPNMSSSMSPGLAPNR